MVKVVKVIKLDILLKREVVPSIRGYWVRLKPFLIDAK